MNERPRERQPLPLPPRVRPYGAFAIRAELEARRHSLVRLLRIDGVKARRELDVRAPSAPGNRANRAPPTPASRESRGASSRARRGPSSPTSTARSSRQSRAAWICPIRWARSRPKRARARIERSPHERAHRPVGLRHRTKLDAHPSLPSTASYPAVNPPTRAPLPPASLPHARAHRSPPRIARPTLPRLVQPTSRPRTTFRVPC